MENSAIPVENSEAKRDLKDKSAPKSWSYKLQAGIFLTSVAGIGFLAGFGGSLAATKKQGEKVVAIFIFQLSKRLPVNHLISFNVIYSRIIKCTRHLLKIGEFEWHN